MSARQALRRDRRASLRRARRAFVTLGLASALASVRAAEARPNTHAPAISTWDPRASSVVLGMHGAVSGSGGFSVASYNANFSSTSGILSAQFGAHYLTYRDFDDAPTARGFAASGVALFVLPLADRFENGVPGSAFAFYLGGVPTALISGELNFISVPLVMGLALPFSPAPSVTFTPWVELSPGLNFDTRIQAISTADAIEAASDGSLTRDEVEALVEQGLRIDRETTVGKRGGLSFALHLGQRVDANLQLMLGAGHAGALGFGGSLVVRWDAMVPGVLRDSERLEDASCEAVAARHAACQARLPAAPSPRPAATKPARPRASLRTAPGKPVAPRPAPGTRAAAPRPSAPAAAPLRPSAPPAAPQPARAPAGAGSPAPTRTAPAQRRRAPAPVPAPPRPSGRQPSPVELPPLQAAPPKAP